jgi:hypothetical protein
MKKYAPYREDNAVNTSWWKMKGKRGKPEAVEAALEAAEREKRYDNDENCFVSMPPLTYSPVYFSQGA